MSFRNIPINKEYRIPGSNIIQEFYLPLLEEAVLYQRSVAYFTSESLYELSFGIVNLLKNEGKIQLIVSPVLSKEDLEAINKGYEARNSITEQALLRYLEEPKNYFEEERLNILANLIAKNKLDLKVAYSLNSDKQLGLYHEKLGILTDKDNSKVAFSGSMNETDAAFASNYETIDVFCSWDEPDRVHMKENAFYKLWNNCDANALVFDFPDAPKNKILSYKKDSIDMDIDVKELTEILKKRDLQTSLDIEDEEKNKITNIPRLPDFLSDGLREYQEKAIAAWKDNNYIGIFDMATGTGKTFTGLGAITQLYNDMHGELFVVICCPLQHLVIQWVEDIYKFNIDPIIAFGSGKYRNYEQKLKNAILDFNLGVQKFCCLICVNDTFSNDFIQSQLSKIKKGSNVLLLVDEAHNFGTQRLLNTLDDRFKYRLALSATFDRYGDEEGTERLYNYFQKKCIEFTLEMAIPEFLTPYYYYPIPITLTAEELDEYHYYSDLIRKETRKQGNKWVLTKKGEILALKRARKVAGASNKARTLEKILEDKKYYNENNILVYCGATKVEDILNEPDNYTGDLKQIELISTIMGKKLGMSVSKFTSEESAKTRNELRKRFAAGDLQALVAIKCLDEGVNIPSIKTAFILASSRNPKEYVQRRGRVLRKYDGKDYAVIYDFVTLPREMDEAYGLTSMELNCEKTLVRNELERVYEFKKISQNPFDSDEFIENAKSSYHLLEKDDIIRMEEGNYE